MIASNSMAWNGLEYTKMFMWSFYQMARIPQDLYFVDMKSEDGTYEYLKRLEEKAPRDIVRLKVIQADKNIGPPLATEMFWREYSPKPEIKYLFRCKSTLYLPQGIQEAGIQIMDSHPDIGVLGFQHNNVVLAENLNPTLPVSLEPPKDVACVFVRNQIFKDHPEFLNVEIRAQDFMAMDFWSLMLSTDTKYKYVSYPDTINCLDFRHNIFIGYEEERDFYKKMDNLGGTARTRINAGGWLPQSISELT